MSCFLHRFSEPIVDNVAHDIYVECSNMGSCDRTTGECSCHAGYEVGHQAVPVKWTCAFSLFLCQGAACERMTCEYLDNGDGICSGNGRCVGWNALFPFDETGYSTE